MPVTIAWGTKVINVPQSYLTNLGGGVYELDVNQFRLDLKNLEDDEAGMPFLRTHNHNTEVTLGGVTIARTFEIINGYTITFENGSYAVKLTGANNNIPDITNVNSVSIRSNNSAGMIVADDASSLWATAIEGSLTAEQCLRVLLAIMAGKSVITNTNPVHVKFRDIADTKDRVDATMDGTKRSSVTLNGT